MDDGSCLRRRPGRRPAIGFLSRLHFDLPPKKSQRDYSNRSARDRTLPLEKRRTRGLFQCFSGLGLVLGAVHAVTPGHSNALLAIYLTGAPTCASRALGASVIPAVTFIAVSAILAVVAAPVFRRAAAGLQAATGMVLLLVAINEVAA